MYYYSMTGKDVIKKLENAGWKLKRVKGSHHIMELGSKRVIIPVHAGHDVKIGTLKSIEKQSGEKLS